MTDERTNRLAVITRLHYAVDNPKWPVRLDTYRTLTLPSLLDQTDSDFDVYVWCEPHHVDQVTALSDRIRCIHGTWEPRASTGKYFINYTPFSSIAGMPEYVTQLGLDSDDQLASTAIAEVKAACTERTGLGGARGAVSLQPVKRDLATGAMFNMKSYERRNKLSPIFALHQPHGDYLFIYEYGHYSKMPTMFDNKTFLYDLAVMNIHGTNESTRITDQDQPLV